MQLVDLEIRRYRSIKDQSGENSIEFEGLDCLVGKNNAGKTNILSAVKFLLDEPEKDRDEELYWQKNTDQTVEIRGFFKVDEEDLDRILDPDKRQDVESSLLTEGEHEGELGICKRVPPTENGIHPKTELLQFLPDHDRLSKEILVEYRDDWWEEIGNEEGFTKTDFRNKMREKYPEIADLVPEGKQRNKGIWEDKFQEYVDSKPDKLDLSLQSTGFKQGTKTLILNEFLPRVISIPAVKEVQSATKRGGELGDVVDQISAEIQEELDQEVEKMLGGFDPRNHPDIKRVESNITEHLSSTFEEQSVQLSFPEFSTKYLFREVDIQIQEENLESLSKENVGEGVKRTLIFSLVRTLADLREGKLTLGDDDDTTKNPRPLLLLYEEAELFLHPSLQKTLLQTFDQLTESNTQVLFSTHSPILIQHETLDTINIVRKEADNGTTVTQFHSVLKERNQEDRSRLTDLKSVSSYIFSEKVVLVEGVSDKIVFEKLSPCLHPKWDFDKQSIPVLDAGGKGDVCRFKRFLDDLGIETFAIFDVDAAKGECQTVVSSATSIDKLEELNDAVEAGFSGPQYSVEDLETEFRMMPWDDAFERLEDLKDRLADGANTSDDDIELLTKILQKCEKSTPPNELWGSSSVEEERVAAVEELLNENVLLLSGELEDYYPCEDGDRKREAALKFDPSGHDPEELCEEFQPLANHEHTDIEVFLSNVFGHEPSGIETQTKMVPEPTN